jgi:hypothetical protein
MAQPAPTQASPAEPSSMIKPGGSSMMKPGGSTMMKPGGSTMMKPGGSSMMKPGGSSMMKPAPTPPSPASTMQPVSAQPAAPAVAATPAATGYPEALARSLMGECLASNNPIKQTLAQDPAVLKKIAPPKLALTRTIVEQAVTRLDREAKNAETRLAEQVKGRETELQALLKDPTRFDQELAELTTAIGSGQVPSEQLPELKRLQADLTALRAKPSSLPKKVKESQEQALRQLREQQQRQEQQIRLCASAVDQLQARYSVAEVTNWYASLFKAP